jgi:hypothetical protein
VRVVSPLGLAAALLALPLVLWYVLRSRRPRIEVSSTFLWERTDRAVAAAVPWQRFRPDRTFWLVLLAVLVGAVALARPAVLVATELGDHTILVLDVSASMLADEEGPTRLELARREAESLIADIGPRQVVSVIEASSAPRVVLSATDDAGAVRRALRGAGPSQGAADLADALVLASALERPGQSTVVHLLTDGVLPDGVAAFAPAVLRVHAIGRERPNLAVTRLEAVAGGGGAAQAFVQVRNFGLLPTGARLRLSVDGQGVLTRDLELGPRETSDLVLSLAVSVDAREIRATVSPTGAGPTGAPATDALSLDDTAFATISGPRTVGALIVGSGNVFLTSALAAVEGVEVRTAASVPDDLAGIDLLVIDRASVPQSATRIPTIFVRPAMPPPGVAVAGAPVEVPSTTFQAPGHPLLADVDLAGTAIAAAQPVEAAALETIVGGPSGPLLLAGRLDQAPVLYLTFDLLESNLPLQVAWPVLMANAVSWLTAPPAVAPLHVGDEARFTLPPGAEGVVVTPPTGAPRELDPLRPRVTVDEVGVWSAAWTGDAAAGLPPPAPIAVNVPPSESDLARDRPQPAGPFTAPAAVEAGTGLRVFGRPLLVGALVLLLLNWAVASVAGRRRGRARGPETGPAAPWSAETAPWAVAAADEHAQAPR